MTDDLTFILLGLGIALCGLLNIIVIWRKIICSYRHELGEYPQFAIIMMVGSIVYLAFGCWILYEYLGNVGLLILIALVFGKPNKRAKRKRY